MADFCNQSHLRSWMQPHRLIAQRLQKKNTIFLPIAIELWNQPQLFILDKKKNNCLRLFWFLYLCRFSFHYFGLSTANALTQQLNHNIQIVSFVCSNILYRICLILNLICLVSFFGLGFVNLSFLCSILDIFNPQYIYRLTFCIFKVRCFSLSP